MGKVPNKFIYKGKEWHFPYRYPKWWYHAKSQRQIRYKALIQDGYVPSEAKRLIRNAKGKPAMLQIRGERRIKVQQWLKECEAHGIRPTIEGWKDVIKDLYLEMGWFDSSGRINPFARLNEIVKKFKKEHPYHETPTKKSKARVSNAGDFQSALKKTREKGYGKLQARLAKV